MGVEFLTGWELGTHLIDAGVLYEGVTASATSVRTGSYSLHFRLNGNNPPRWQLPLAVTGPDFYLGFAFAPTDFYSGKNFYFDFILDGANYVRVEYCGDDNNKLELYSNAALLDTSAADVIHNVWNWVEIYLHVHDTTGVVQVKVDGDLAIDYAGDTKPSTGVDLTNLKFHGQSNVWAYDAHMDDLILRDDDWPGDVHVVKLVPNADTAQADWAPSAGVDHYAVIDEIPASDADYIESDTDGQQDLFDLPDFDAEYKTIVGIATWIRAKRTTAGAQEAKIVLNSGVTEDVGPAVDLYTTFQHHYRIDDEDPNTAAAWTEAGINALEVGVESDIP